ncbi:MAG TPA: M20/M25/M40 family metallo-hydrolase, partial [Bacillota bacterium]|nr:M20/M25/M40 family metallo-hydrolase [Bacillota bacterium]
KPNALKLMLDAHLDEVGFLVKDIVEGGFLKLTSCGGIDTGILSGSEVTVYGKETFTGVITSVPPHLRSGDSSEKPKLSDLSVDTGYSVEKLRQIAPIGTPVSYKSPVMHLAGDRICGKSFDDRICMLAILGALDMIKGKDVFFDIYANFASGEETGYIGARTGAYEIDPDYAIALDVGNAYIPGAAETRKQNVLGKGGVVSFSATLDRRIIALIVKAAEDTGIPYQTVAEPAHTGTDAHIFQLTRAGIPGGLISIPLFNMHTYNEVCSIVDVENTSKLLAAFITTAGKELSE